MTVPIVPEMKELMLEIVNIATYDKNEKDMIDAYFNDYYSFVNTKAYKYGLDDDCFVIRKDCHANKRSIYGWDFINGVPHALISKIDLRKSKIDIRSKKSVYSKIFNSLEMDLDKWLNEV